MYIQREKERRESRGEMSSVILGFLFITNNLTLRFVLFKENPILEIMAILTYKIGNYGYIISILFICKLKKNVIFNLYHSII